MSAAWWRNLVRHGDVKRLKKLFGNHVAELIQEERRIAYEKLVERAEELSRDMLE